LLGPSGKPFQSVSEAVHQHAQRWWPCNAHLDRVLLEDFLLRPHSIGGLVEIQFVAVGDHLDPQLQGRINRIAFFAVSLVHANNFVRVALPLF